MRPLMLPVEAATEITELAGEYAYHYCATPGCSGTSGVRWAMDDHTLGVEVDCACHCASSDFVPLVEFGLTGVDMIGKALVANDYAIEYDVIWEDPIHVIENAWLDLAGEL